MTETERKKALVRVKKLAGDAQHLAVYGKALEPTTLATLMAELADEVAKILEAPQRQKRRRNP